MLYICPFGRKIKSFARAARSATPKEENRAAAQILGSAHGGANVASIYIRDVDEALIYRLKRNALDSGISLKEYCIELLSAADPVTKPLPKKRDK